MERKIGETFEFEGKKLKVVENNDNYRCKKCFFCNRDCSLISDVTGYCLKEKRIDRKGVTFVEVKDEQPQEQAEQPRELNLCEILKDCPQGETLWSPLLGGVKFHDINQKRNFIVISLENGETWDINADGTITFGDVTSPEIMLYPSREQRDWAKVKYEPRKERFDPKTLKPFDRVLCKNGLDMWRCDFFSSYMETYVCQNVCISGSYTYCIPYNDDTKHLVGTKDEAPEYYRYWED